MTTTTPARRVRTTAVLVVDMQNDNLHPDGVASTAAIGVGTGQVVVGDGVLTLLAAGPDEASVGAVERGLGSHLERFAQRRTLVVRWTPSADQAG
jgi:nicotinamidase-related amidase